MGTIQKFQGEGAELFLPSVLGCKFFAENGFEFGTLAGERDVDWEAAVQLENEIAGGQRIQTVADDDAGASGAE